MQRHRAFFFGLLLCLAAPATAQNRSTVVTPAPAPREGTVGPEQLRDFSLPGTRQTAPEAEPAPAPERPPLRPAPPTTRPQPTSNPVAQPPASTAPLSRRSTTTTVRAEPAPANSQPEFAPPTVVTPALPPQQTLPVIPPAATLPTPTEVQPAGAWWPWLLVAAVAGIGLALLARKRSRSVVDAGPEQAYSAASPPPTAPTPPPEAPQAPAVPTRLQEPALPSGLVTTRLRSSKVEPETAPLPPVPVGAVVSTRLRPWIDLDIAVGDVVLTASGAVLRVDLSLTNGGSAYARDIAIEALPLNAGERQGDELTTFFARPRAADVAMAGLAPMSSTQLNHSITIPRSSIREYEANGRAVFVPLLAFTIHYSWSSGSGQTSAVFLVGHEAPGSERLAPLRLDHDAPRLTRIGVRRLDQAIRR